MQFLESPVEGHEGGGLSRDSLMWPGHVVELSHIQSSLRLVFQLGESHHEISSSSIFVIHTHTSSSRFLVV